MRSRGASAPVLVVGSSAVAGLLGFVITFLAARDLGPAATAGFTAVWSGIYVVGAALGGAQQEVARAVRPSPEGTRSRTLPIFLLGGAGLVLVVVALIAAAWTPPVFGARAPFLVAPLAIGPAGYFVWCVILGALFGAHAYRRAAVTTVLDPVLRMAAVIVALALTHDLPIIAWAVAIPFGATVLLLTPLLRPVLSRLTFDVDLARLARNTVQAVAGSIAMAVVSSGLTVLVVLTSTSEPASAVGALTFAVTVVRAPIMVGAMALQSYVVVRYRDRPHPGRTLLAAVSVLVGAGLVGGLLAAWVGDPLLRILAGPGFEVGPWMLFAIVLSSALVGSLFLTGPIAIARSRHVVYAVGWIATAVATVAALLLPLGLDARVATAVVIPPILGILIHLLGLRRSSRSRDA